MSMGITNATVNTPTISDGTNNHDLSRFRSHNVFVLGKQSEPSPDFKLPEIRKIELLKPLSFNATNSPKKKIKELNKDLNELIKEFISDIYPKQDGNSISFAIQKENFNDENLEKDPSIVITPTSIDEPIYFYVKSLEKFKYRYNEIFIKHHILKLIFAQDKKQNYIGNISHFVSIESFHNYEGKDSAIGRDPIKMLSIFLFLHQNGIHQYSRGTNGEGYDEVFLGRPIMRDALMSDIGKTIEILTKFFEENPTIKSEICPTFGFYNYQDLAVKSLLCLFMPEIVNKHGDALLSSHIARHLSQAPNQDNPNFSLSDSFLKNRFLETTEKNEIIYNIQKIIQAALKKEDPWLSGFIQGMRSSSEDNKKLLDEMLMPFVEDSIYR